MLYIPVWVFKSCQVVVRVACAAIEKDVCIASLMDNMYEFSDWLIYQKLSTIEISLRPILFASLPYQFLDPTHSLREVFRLIDYFIHYEKCYERFQLAVCVTI